jgi:hypothetical protein
LKNWFHLKQFDKTGWWNKKIIHESPLIEDFDSMWNNLSSVCAAELSILAFAEIPNEKDVANTLPFLIKNVEIK